MTKFRRTTAVALAAALAVTSFSLAPAQAGPAAKPQQAQTQPAEAATIDLSARKRHYRSNRNGQRAAIAMFGLMAGTMAALAARDRYRDYGYYDRGYYGRGYYGPRYYGGGYYRHQHYGPGYYRRQHPRTQHEW